MLHFLYKKGQLVNVGTFNTSTPYDYDTFINRNDIRSFEQAEQIASDATELMGEKYIPVDDEYVLPRYDVIKAPQVGSKVSRGFNGDYYPEGEITKISPTMKKVTTSTGATFFRKKNSGSWYDGPFVMIEGEVLDIRNSSF